MKYLASQKGFTLVEMIVSLAIFTVVAVVAVGALLKITDANRKSQTLKTAINNLNFALESMSREMRVGANYAVGANINEVGFNALNDVIKEEGSISDDSWVVAFNTSKTNTFTSGPLDGEKCNLIHAYRYDYPAKTLHKAEQTECGEDLSDLTFHPVISADVKITHSILNIVSSPSAKPKAFFWFMGYTGDGAREKTEFELQTTVSQRIAT